MSSLFLPPESPHKQQAHRGCVCVCVKISYISVREFLFISPITSKSNIASARSSPSYSSYRKKSQRNAQGMKAQSSRIISERFTLARRIFTLISCYIEALALHSGSSSSFKTHYSRSCCSSVLRFIRRRRAF